MTCKSMAMRVRVAFLRALMSTGSVMPMISTMIEMVTRSSTSVKPLRFRDWKLVAEDDVIFCPEGSIRFRR